MPYKKEINLEEYLHKRDPEVIRAKDMKISPLHDKSSLIRDLKMMDHYKRTLCVVLNDKDEYIEITKWKDPKNDCRRLNAYRYKPVSILDYFDASYGNALVYKFSRVFNRVKKGSSFASDKPKKSIRLDNPSEVNDDSSSKIHLDRSAGVIGVIKQFEAMDEYDFLDYTSLVQFSEYIKKLPNRYSSYIIIELLADYGTMHQRVELFPKIKDKQKRKNKYLSAIDRLEEIKELFTLEQIDMLKEIENTINKVISLSQKDYKQSIKASILKKLKKYFSDTAAKEIYSIIKYNH